LHKSWVIRVFFSKHIFMCLEKKTHKYMLKIGTNMEHGIWNILGWMDVYKYLLKLYRKIIKRKKDNKILIL
jgi:hypothetical protein